MSFFSPHWRSELARIVRFFCVALGASLIDAAVGLSLANGLGLSLSYGVVAGFLVGLVCAYILHRLWTFRVLVQQGSGVKERGAGCAKGQLEHSSAVRFLISNAGLLALRLGVVQVLDFLCAHLEIALSSAINTAIYVIMLGVSFCINYIACRVWVFKAR